MTNASKPQLKRYLDIHHFLQDLYEYRKRTEDGFSYETWSQELDFTNRSFLRQVVTGRRSLTTETAELLKKRLHFETSDKDYFDLLIRYSRATNHKEKEVLGQQMMKILKSESSQCEIGDYHAFISKPLHPQVQTLLSFVDIPKTPENLARILNKDLADVEEALLLLQKIKMAEKDEFGEWRAVVRSFKVSDKLGSQALLQYHREALGEAIEASKLPPSERRYRSLLLPLNPDEFAVFLSEFNDFAERMKRKFDIDDFRGRKLHQVNLNIYSVSESAVP